MTKDNPPGRLACPRCQRIAELLACSRTGGVHFAVEPERSSVEVTFDKRDEAGEMSAILCDLHPLDDEGCFIHGAPLPAARTTVEPTEAIDERAREFAEQFADIQATDFSEMGDSELETVAAKIRRMAAAIATLRTAAPDRPTYAPAGLKYAAVDQNDQWLLRFADQDCGDQWFGGPHYTAEETRDLAIAAWNKYAPAWSVRLMRTVTLDEVRTAAPNDALVEAWQPIETAPKDGTWVLTWSECEGPGMGRYAEWLLNEGGKPFDQATHWQPLPDPPAALNTMKQAGQP